MRCALAIAVFVAMTGCTTDESSGLEGTTHVEDVTIPGPGLAQRDVLIVVDDTAAMASYRDRLAALPALFDHAFGRTDRGLIDLRIAVTSNDGVLRRTPSMTEPFLAMRTDFDLVRTTNFARTFGEELATLVDVGTAGAGPSTLLDAAALALENDEGGFRRADASLAILFISATDDASSSPIESYFARIPARVVSAIVPGDAPRYGAFLEQPADVGSSYAIDATDYTPAIENLRTRFSSILPGMCWFPADVDPGAPGGQYDCTVTALVRDRELVLPPCKAEGDLVCWRMLPSTSCDLEGALELDVPAFWFYASSPTIHMQCVVE
jgi:hypothetical protein